MEGAKYVIRYGLCEDVPYAMDQEFIFQDNFLTEEYIQNQKNFLSTVQDLGLVPSGWSDFVEFVQLE